MLHHTHNHHKHNHGALAASLRTSSGNEAAVIRKVVIIGLVVNALLMILKIATGFYGHSEALVADGFHSLNDFASDFIVLIFIGIAYRKADAKYTYGYGKFETFVSLLISAILCIASIMIFKEGVESIIAAAKGERLPHPDFLTIIVAFAAIICKELLYHYTSSTGKKTESSALIANAWHQRSDALASVATLIGVACSHFLSDRWAILDPCASILISVIIATAGVRMLLPAFRELMERSLPEAVSKEAAAIIKATEGVDALKELKSRRNGHFLIFDISILVNPSLTIDQGFAIAENIRNKLEERFGTNTIVSVATLPDKNVEC